MGDELRDEVPAALGVIEGALGEGATGAVYLLRRPDGSRVALKVLRRALADDPELVARFRQEARALQNTLHPSVIRVLGEGSLPDGRPYLITELLEGETLATWLRGRSGGASPSEAWRVIRAVGEALEAAHARGVIHRDVKPSNVFLCEGSGRVVLMDFGLARLPEAVAAVRTRTGAAMGTPAYMSPELWWGALVSPSVDQYALGATAFELMTGAPPFAPDALPDLLRAHLDRAPPRLSASRPGVFSEAHEAWVARCLAKTPEDRFPSMRALLDEGARCFGETRPRSPLWALLAPALSLLAGVLAGYGGSHDPRVWAQLAGWSWAPVCALSLFGCAALVAGSPRAALFSVAAAVCGALGAITGFAAVERGLARAPATQAFELFNLGIAEANSARFIGGVAAVGLCLGAPVFGARARWRRRDALGLAWLLLALVAALSGHPSVALIALCGSAIDLVRGDAGSPWWSLWASLAACSTALARTSGAAGRAWEGELDRAARAAVLIDASKEQRVVLLVGGLLLIERALELLRSRGGGRGGVGRWGVAMGLAWALMEAGFEQRVASRREALYAELAPQFALLWRVDPPAAQGLPRPSRAPSLRLARDAVAVDDAASVLPEALATSMGRSVLAADLSHRLARRDGARRLSLMVDRRVEWATVARALGVAWGVGVREVEVLFTRGAALRWRAGAPVEAGYALPRDFGVVRVRLSEREGERVDGVDRSFGEVSGDWPSRGALVLRVP